MTALDAAIAAAQDAQFAASNSGPIAPIINEIVNSGLLIAADDEEGLWDALRLIAARRGGCCVCPDPCPEEDNDQFPACETCGC